MRKRIVLVRHGESQGNILEVGGKTKETYINDSEIELSSEGYVQATNCGNRLKEYLTYNNIDFCSTELWVSPFTRTRQTAMRINDVLQLNKVYEDPRLVEQDYGDFDFQFFRDWKNISPHSYFINQMRYNSEKARFWAKVEGGESIADVYNRISLFDISRVANNPNTQIIVSHGIFIRTAIVYFSGLKIEDVCSIEKIENAKAYVLEKESSEFVYTYVGVI